MEILIHNSPRWLSSFFRTAFPMFFLRENSDYGIIAAETADFLQRKEETECRLL